jgi:E3 ubiquitin-protein ligase HUWE1
MGTRLMVNRDRVFEDSFEQLNKLEADKWRGKFHVEFENEAGIDEGGLLKEWYILLSQASFREDLALFVKTHEGSTYYPNPKSTIQPNYTQLFAFVGKMVGKSLWDQ